MNKEIVYENKKIRYRVSGKGKPLILVHGFGEDGTVWDRQAAFLEDTCRLIIPDLPGSGLSEMINDMSMEGMAETIHAIVHEEAVGTCTMIGHSMGGYVTLAFAEKYPNHLHAMGLFHTTAFADTDEKKLTREKGIEFIRAHGAFTFLKTVSPNLFSPHTQLTNPAMIRNFIEGLTPFTPAALIACYRAMMDRPDRTGLLKLVKIPILFIMGEFDNAVSYFDTLKQCHLPEKCYIHMLNKSGHMGMMEEPGKANRILEEFLKHT